LSRLDIAVAAAESTYLAPFRDLLTSADAPAAVLMAHTTFADDDIPAGLSSYWVTDVLRGDFAYTGVVVTDDIYMKALADNGYPPEKAVAAAIDAGVDIIMLANQTFRPAHATLTARAAVDSVFAEKITTAATRVLTFKMYCGIL
jgi:beta-N-acetylhexosaminidase